MNAHDALTAFRHHHRSDTAVSGDTMIGAASTAGVINTVDAIAETTLAIQSVAAASAAASLPLNQLVASIIAGGANASSATSVQSAVVPPFSLQNAAAAAAAVVAASNVPSVPNATAAAAAAAAVASQLRQQQQQQQQAVLSNASIAASLDYIAAIEASANHHRVAQSLQHDTYFTVSTPINNRLQPTPAAQLFGTAAPAGATFVSDVLPQVPSSTNAASCQIRRCSAAISPHVGLLSGQDDNVRLNDRVDPLQSSLDTFMAQASNSASQQQRQIVYNSGRVSVLPSPLSVSGYSNGRQQQSSPMILSSAGSQSASRMLKRSAVQMTAQNAFTLAARSTAPTPAPNNTSDALISSMILPTVATPSDNSLFSSSSSRAPKLRRLGSFEEQIAATTASLQATNTALAQLQQQRNNTLINTVPLSAAAAASTAVLIQEQQRAAQQMQNIQEFIGGGANNAETAGETLNNFSSMVGTNSAITTLLNAPEQLMVAMAAISTAASQLGSANAVNSTQAPTAGGPPSVNVAPAAYCPACMACAVAPIATPSAVTACGCLHHHCHHHHHPLCLQQSQRQQTVAEAAAQIAPSAQPVGDSASNFAAVIAAMHQQQHQQPQPLPSVATHPFDAQAHALAVAAAASNATSLSVGANQSAAAAGAIHNTLIQSRTVDAVVAAIQRQQQQQQQQQQRRQQQVAAVSYIQQQQQSLNRPELSANHTALLAGRYAQQERDQQSSALFYRQQQQQQQQLQLQQLQQNMQQQQQQQQHQQPATQQQQILNSSLMMVEQHHPNSAATMMGLSMLVFRPETATLVLNGTGGTPASVVSVAAVQQHAAVAAAVAAAAGGAEPHPVGASFEQISKYSSILSYNKDQKVTDHERDRCTVCLMEYEAGDELRSLHCSHMFHVDCIDRWLIYNKKCPLCRVDMDKASAVLSTTAAQSVHHQNNNASVVDTTVLG